VTLSNQDASTGHIRVGTTGDIEELSKWDKGRAPSGLLVLRALRPIGKEQIRIRGSSQHRNAGPIDAAPQKHLVRYAGAHTDRMAKDGLQRFLRHRR
jgi:hypothetical protein